MIGGDQTYQFLEDLHIVSAADLRIVTVKIHTVAVDPHSVTEDHHIVAVDFRIVAEDLHTVAEDRRQERWLAILHHDSGNLPPYIYQIFLILICNFGSAWI